ncbi:unnamed protein product [Triticum turgidum subsp. durum]|uniref:Protein NRT1/ PTR FAMILY 3.1 n=1 Tax=Triticum turgidum subsp. durum TaxID=4567 RepID=A0A9R1BLB4_TRITD|nr:unnamed protein product [Triticum turgidum subsp. durum]
MQRGVAASACSTTECTTAPLPPQAQPMAAEAAMDGKKGKRKGGLRTMPFIFANEVAEKLAVVGFSTNMLTYLTQQMHMPLAKAATTLTNFGGTSAMTPLIGAYLADACIGRFWYYFCNGASQLVAVTAVVYVQDNVGWGWGLGVPAFCMGVSVIAFVGGYPMYRRLDPSGSPFTRLAQVAVAAVRKRRVPKVEDPGRLYENDEMDAPISMYGKLVHTPQLSFFDRAANITDGDLPRTDASSSKQPLNLWRLSTVHRVEELKSVVRMGPIWAAGILVITASSQQHTFSLQQASTMDRRIAPHSSFKIPAGSMTVFTMLAMLVTLFVYDRALVPLARRRTGLDRGISFLHRMGVGFTISVAASLVAGFVERHRREAAAAGGTTDAGTAPLSVYWLVPQYALHGVAEAFNSVGHLEFMYDQAPESMRSTATALFWLSISLGSYVSTLLITIVHRWSAGPDGSNWLPDNINRGKLDYFYWVVTLLQVMNLVYYLICARQYTYKPVQHHEEEEGEDKSMVELQQKV